MERIELIGPSVMRVPASQRCGLYNISVHVDGARAEGLACVDLGARTLIGIIAEIKSVVAMTEALQSIKVLPVESLLILSWMNV